MTQLCCVGAHRSYEENCHTPVVTHAGMINSAYQHSGCFSPVTEHNQNQMKAMAKKKKKRCLHFAVVCMSRLSGFDLITSETGFNLCHTVNVIKKG